MELLLIFGLIYWISKNVKKTQEKQKQREAAWAQRQADAYEEVRHSAPTPVVPQSTPIRPRVQPQATAPQQRRHTLNDSRTAGHAHMETSLTGSKDTCPPVSTPLFEKAPLADRLAAYKAEKRRTEHPAAAYASEQAPQVIDLAAVSAEPFRFDPTRVREGLIYAEILGKPKALRR